MALALLCCFLMMFCLVLWWLAKPDSVIRSSRLFGEELELRAMLDATTYMWGGAGTGLEWSGKNWRVMDPDTNQWTFTDDVPGVDDDVIFSGKFNTDCVIRSSAIVHSITIADGYTKELAILGSLALSGFEGSVLALKSRATLSGVGAAVGKGKLILSGESVFNWETGALNSTALV